MRRIATISVLAMVMLALTATVALAAVRYGTNGPDNIKGTNAPDSLYGYGGGDRIYGGHGGDLIKGGPGNDDPGFDVGPAARGLYGGAGNDAIHGGGDVNDAVDGSAGGDLLSGGPGNDDINGVAGEPTATRDEISCGTGADFVEAARNDYVAPDCETVKRY